jgi:hypothetical protein
MVLHDRQMVDGYFKKLPLDLHRYIYKYLIPEIMLPIWLEEYDLRDIILNICDKYCGFSAYMLHKIYSIYNRNDAKLLFWRHAVPLREKGRYWYIEDDINYDKFSAQLEKMIRRAYKKTPNSHNLYKVMSSIIYINRYCVENVQEEQEETLNC